MSNLRDIEHVQLRTRRRRAGRDDDRDVLERRREARRHRLHAREGARHLAQWTWDRRRRRCARSPTAARARLRAGDCASILSNTVVEWVLADLAVLSCGGVSNGIYPTDAAARCTTCARTRARRSCSSRTRSSSTRRSRCARGCRCCQDRRLRHGRACTSFRDPEVLEPRCAARARPRARASASGRARRAGRGCRPQDLAMLVYTSGTTGKPKGAMHSHARHRLQRSRGYNMIVAQDERDERMCFLPLCHIAERLGGAYSRSTPARSSTSSSGRDSARERARDRARPCSPPCRACGRSSTRASTIALREAEPAAATGLSLGDRRGHAIAERTLAGQPIRRRLRCGSASRAGSRSTTCAS